MSVGDKPVPAPDKLFAWDTTRYPDGEHQLRLRVVHSNLNYDEYYIPVSINNHKPVAVPRLPSVKEVVQPTPAAAPPEPTRAKSASDNFSTVAPVDRRWIEIDLSDQRLTAWDGNDQVLETVVSTGRTQYPTVTGTYYINSKLPSTRMRGAGYDMPDVPWTMYFFRRYAIHGAYWHNDFGVPVSHGCVNLPVAKAKLLFEWARLGTKVTIHK